MQLETAKSKKRINCQLRRALSNPVNCEIENCAAFTILLLFYTKYTYSYMYPPFHVERDWMYKFITEEVTRRNELRNKIEFILFWRIFCACFVFWYDLHCYKARIKETHVENTHLCRFKKACLAFYFYPLVPPKKIK